jgi:hypothetical protein
LIWGETPSAGEFGYVVAFAIVILAAGIVVFSRGEGTFAKYV